MNTESFFENFSLLTESPNGIQKQRKMILQMAVQGKLVPQNPDDEPAEMLLEKIKAEKKVKLNKRLIPISSCDLPFDIPFTWKWVRFGQIVDFNIGKTPKTKVSEYWNEEGVSWVSIADMVNYGEITKTTKSVSQKAVDEVFKSNPVPDGTILMSFKLTIGKTSILKVEAFHNEAIISIFPPYNNLKEYLFKVLPILTSDVDTNNAIKGKTLNKTSLSNLLIPLPPLEEQKCIATKVNQLMDLCDKLESLQQNKQEKQIHLNNVALNKMLDASTPEEFEKYWRFVCDNFGLLYDNLENVEKIREVILQLAVMGKLVEQDAEDEPAEILLETIKAEKERLVKEGKISNSKKLPPIKEDEIAFKIPKTWKWTRLGISLLKITDGTHNSPPNNPHGDFKYITAKSIKKEGINLSNITYVTSEVHEKIYSRCNPEYGDILYIKDGATTGIATINNLKESFSMLSSVALMKLPSKLNNRYLLHLLRSPYFYSMMREDMTGVAITRVTLTKLNNAAIPLPPLKEQKRIVAKVDQLMDLCDKLESSIRQAQEDGERLMDLSVNGLLSSCY